MSEVLQVRNFLVVKEAAIDIKKINVLIGRQASGKSLIAKLAYFFRQFPNHFVEAIRSQSPKRELDKSIVDDFEIRFPRYVWEGTEFEVLYEFDEIHIKIVGKLSADGKTKVSVSYSDNLYKLFNSTKTSYTKRLKESQVQEEPQRRLPIRDLLLMQEYAVEILKQSKHGRFFSSSVFVPASRSFFANLQKNIFTFMASNLDIDPFLKDFGSLYESSKVWYRTSSYLPRKPEQLANMLDRAIEAVINGRYEYDDKQDWIQSKGHRVNLVHASSGQQEALPMLLTLAVWPFFRGQEGSMFFIEEPEAHLFPTSQSRIVSMLTALSSILNIGFFVTTHSPYVLSALNNNILAGDVKSAKRITDAEYQKIGGDGYPINFEDVSAYTLHEGTAKKITDAEYRMIGAEVLDEVSDHFQEVMNELLERKGVH